MKVRERERESERERRKKSMAKGRMEEGREGSFFFDNVKE